MHERCMAVFTSYLISRKCAIQAGRENEKNWELNQVVKRFSKRKKQKTVMSMS